jgi:hypothetical protein
MELSYSEILRVIGEDLEGRGLKAFDLQPYGDRYVLHGGYQSPPAVTPLVLEYRDADLQQMRLAGIEMRAERPRNVDFSALTQTLRTIGAYLDQRKASLYKITNNEFSGGDPVFRLDYEIEGEAVSERRAAAELYDLGVRLYKQRRSDKDRGVRFGQKGSAALVGTRARQLAPGQREER